MRVFLRSSMFECAREPSLWTRLCKADPEEGTRRVVAPAKMPRISRAKRKKEGAPTVDVPQQKITAPSHRERVSTPHHQAAEAQAIMRMSTHEYHRTGDVRHILRAQRAQQHLNQFAAQGITPTAQHHADWVDHYAEHGDKYGKSPISAMTRARWHKIAGGIEFSGYEHKPEWTEAQMQAHLAKIGPRDESLPASDLPFTRPPRVSPPKVKETIGYTRKIIPYQKSLFNLLLMKACSLDLWKAKMGRPHKQAHAIAFRMREKHYSE